MLDVHVNRAPVAGKVVDYFVADGGFAAAMKPEAEHNVAAYTVLDTDHGTVVVAQRTGLIARRIVQRAPIGALLARGERFGLIRFGSRTDVYLPAERPSRWWPRRQGDRRVNGDRPLGVTRRKRDEGALRSRSGGALSSGYRSGQAVRRWRSHSSGPLTR